MSVVNRRDDQIAALKARVDRLDSARLAECYGQIVDAYEAETIVDSLARVEQLTDREPSGFRVISNQETRRLSHFNDPTYHWQFYCEQLGRSIALGETAYVFEKMMELPSSDLTINASEPRFGVIEQAMRRVKRAGYRPSILFAPISLMVPFETDPTLRIDWQSDSREALVPGDGTRLLIVWSSRSAPLNKFVIADASAGTWKVKLDAETQHRLTVAIGRPEAPPEGVVFMAETVVRYEIADPKGFSVIDLEGEPPDEYDMTRQ